MVMSYTLRFVFATIICSLITSCGKIESDAPKSQPSEGRPVIALVMKSLANEFFVTMANGARKHHAENTDQYDLIVNGIKNEIDLAQQVALVDQMIALKVEAIVIAPADSKAIVPALARAIKNEILVINIDNRLDETVLRDYGLDIPFVGPDNYSGAYMVGSYLAEHLSPGQQVAILEGVPTAYNSQQRTAGFRRSAEDGGLTVVTQQSAQWDQTAAVTVTSGILIQNTSLAAIIAANDNMALGALAAIRQSGKTGQLLIVGFDNISAVRQLVKAGVILATADQHADLLAVYGIEYALQGLSSGVVLKDRATPVDLITSANVE